MSQFRAAVLTGGGDTQALNATLFGIVKAAEEHSGEVIGFRRGWAGPLFPDRKYEVVNGNEKKTTTLDTITGEYVVLTPQDVNPRQGGTIILSSRANLTKVPRAYEDVVERLRSLGIDYFLAIGGDDTTSVFLDMARSSMFNGTRVIAVPKTIDNDIGTMGPSGQFDGFGKVINIWTPGYPSAVKNARDFADSTYSTAYTHERVMWVEVMGRNAGFLALAMGDRAGAHMTLIPEDPIKLEDILERTLGLYRRHGFFYGVISEGTIDAATGKPISEDPFSVDPHGHKKLGGAAKVMARLTKEYFKAHGVSAPYFNGQVFEYGYRGGPPHDIDREAAIALGRHALTSLLENSAVNNHMAVLMQNGKGPEPSNMPLEQAVMIGTDGRVQPRKVPINLKSPGNGFYDPDTKKTTALGRSYVELLGVPEIEFQPWGGQVHR